MGAYATEVGDTGMDVVNVEQAAAWNGHEGEVWTEQADRYDRASRRILRRFLDANLVQRADRVVDIGCGTGGPSRAVACIASEGRVLGVDLSACMLELAQRRSADDNLTNVKFVQGDAQVFPFDAGAFDLAISSFGAMFFGDRAAAFTNIRRSLGPDGRLALLAWRSLPENEWLTSFRAALAVGRDLPAPPLDAPTPFALADPARVHDLLSRAGFSAIGFSPIDEAIELGVDVADALEFAATMGIVEGLLDGLDDHDRATAMARLTDLFTAHESPDGVLLGSAAWVITARVAATA